MSTSPLGARLAAARPIDHEYPDRDEKPMEDDTLKFNSTIAAAGFSQPAGGL